MKDKVQAKAIKEGKKGVKLQIQAKAKGWGSMKCQLDYHLESEDVAAAMWDAVKEAQNLLDGLEVDPTDDESLKEYMAACGEALGCVMAVVSEAVE